jgi:hypothetical protein
MVKHERVSLYKRRIRKYEQSACLSWFYLRAPLELVPEFNSPDPLFGTVLEHVKNHCVR